MTLAELLEALAAAGARLAIDPQTGRLRYVGPKLQAGTPVARALAVFRDEVLWLLTSGRLCRFCPRWLDDGERIACRAHRRQLEAAP